MDKKDLKFEYMRGTGPGGQHKNKTETACRVTHIPTGVTAYADERSRKHSRKSALNSLRTKLQEAADEAIARRKKSRRDHAIKNEERVRTYDYSRNTVTDHRTGKTATIKDILVKGKLDLLREDFDV